MQFATTLFPALVALATTLPVAAVPVPDTATTAVAAVLDGLPSCAHGFMGKMVSRAASYGCPSHPDGTPNVVCLCRSKSFKHGAKRGVGDLCPNNSASISRSREWAIELCTAAIRADNLGVNRAAVPAPAPGGGPTTFPGISVSGPTTMPTLPKVTDTSMAPGRGNLPAGAGAFKPMDSKVVPALAMEVFKIDDDEDETARAEVVRPGGVLALVVAVGVGVVIL
ncbi:hypothetical protein C8A05DRAFT_31943 [Staphylotrichum tortipilum]|uniref:Extracellular membrane protein CFEM domain-containing protein n=1 Tax=Staphylotrichum tortipilum TaxID=2831512 RepID=A0AAN6RUT9_9PEZI|nr:hypothetical protein C8A05DRAFT_31943 [Staphylotrichum longicolle]